MKGEIFGMGQYELKHPLNALKMTDIHITETQIAVVRRTGAIALHTVLDHRA
jgi:hypothetical protein